MQRLVRVLLPPLERVDHLPDGSAGLCYLLLADGRAHLFATGPFTRPLYTRPEPFTLAIHVGFPPGGAHAYFGVPLEAIADQIVPARELWGERADRLLDELGAHGTAIDAPTMHARRAAIERALDARGRDGVRVEPAAAAIARAAVARLARAHAPIRDLASDLQISERSLRRAFAAAIGVSPKVYARIARFRRVTARAGVAAGRWAEVAREAGYADQSHLVNEFRALAGVAPSEFVRPGGTDALRKACPYTGTAG